MVGEPFGHIAGFHGEPGRGFSTEPHRGAHSSSCSLAMAAVLLHFLGQSGAILSEVTVEVCGLLLIYVTEPLFNR